MRDPTLDWKYLTVARLRELLDYLPDDFRVGPNAVMNLAIYDRDGPETPKHLGCIDFNTDGDLNFGPE